MERFEYPVLLKAADEGGFVVTCRDLPPLITQGEDKAEALTRDKRLRFTKCSKPVAGILDLYDLGGFVC